MILKVYHINKMKTTLFLLAVLVLKLLLDVKNTDWKSWLDGLALGITIAALLVQMMRRKQNNG